MERPLNVLPHDRHFFMSHSFPFGTGVQILDTTTTKTFHVCAPPSHLCWRNTYTTWGHFTSAIRRKTEIVLQRADCICIVQSVSSFSCLTGMVLFSLTDQKREKISQRHENQRLSAEQISPLSCSIQIKG